MTNELLYSDVVRDIYEKSLCLIILSKLSYSSVDVVCLFSVPLSKHCVMNVKISKLESTVRYQTLQSSALNVCGKSFVGNVILISKCLTVMQTPLRKYMYVDLLAYQAHYSLRKSNTECRTLFSAL